MAPPRVARHLDLALAGGLATLGVAEIAVPFTTVMGDGSPALAGCLVVVTSLALLLRRRRPLLALALVMPPWALVSLVVPVPVLFWGALGPMCVAVYSVARYGVGRTPFVGAAVAAISLLLFTIGTGMIATAGEVFFPVLVLSAAWAAGYLVHGKERAASASERRAREAEARSEELTLAALAEERARIARELHDIVAHTVTAIVVDAGAASQLVEEDPAAVRRSLDRIRHTGSDALGEMRRVVTLLRDRDEPESIRPQPGVANLEALVASAGSADTRVELRVSGEARSLPPGADLAAYRIIQEALTNARRHARATEVTVTIRYGAESLELEVRDNGVGLPPATSGRAPGDGHGQGLIGMRERIAIYGGRLEIDSPAASGVCVRAVLPVERVP